jgi:ArsR family transcriptional regulator, arsenate/arsenite/antimonite-responsive transcriptional repressor
LTGVDTACYGEPVSIRECARAYVPKRDFSAPAALFKVLADPHRLKILATIARNEEEVCVCDLTGGLPLEQPTISHHLKVLRESGLVLSERRGTWVYYRLAPGAIDALRDAVGAIERGGSRSLKRTG